jgi:hypothetical protein
MWLRRSSATAASSAVHPPSTAHRRREHGCPDSLQGSQGPAERAPPSSVGTHPVPRKEFDRLMGLIRDQARDYPQEAIENIFLCLDAIEKCYGIGDSVD